MTTISDFNLFERLLKKLKENYLPGCNATIDEMLFISCVYPQQIRQIQNQMQILTDSKTHDMVNAEIYMGKNLNPIKSKLLNPTQVLLRLISFISNSNHKVTGVL